MIYFSKKKNKRKRSFITTLKSSKSIRLLALKIANGLQSPKSKSPNAALLTPKKKKRKEKNEPLHDNGWIHLGF